MTAGDHPLLASRQDALAHRDWLLGMVGRFKQEKAALAMIRAEYADTDDKWIRPKRD